MQCIQRATGEEGRQKEQEAGVGQRREDQIPCGLVDGEIGVRIKAVPAPQEVVDRIHRALARSGRPNGEA